MREILEDVERWRHDGKRFALATVVSVWGSAPRQPGSKMAVSSTGEIAGSVSGGCVEGAVAERALEVLENGKPALVRFGVTNEQAWEVGLTCGGKIEIFVETPRAQATTGLYVELKRSIDEDAWWHVTTVTWPEGTMDPPGTPVDDGETGDGPATALTIEKGWTVEAWVMPSNSTQTGSIATYRKVSGLEAKGDNHD